MADFTFDDDVSRRGPSAQYDVPTLQRADVRKARAADATNPNIYHSVESLKENQPEHVYDEIEHGFNPYDRLTYSSPLRDVKKHYYPVPDPKEDNQD